MFFIIANFTVAGVLLIIGILTVLALINLVLIGALWWLCRVSAAAA